MRIVVYTARAIELTATSTKRLRPKIPIWLFIRTPPNRLTKCVSDNQPGQRLRSLVNS